MGENITIELLRELCNNDTIRMTNHVFDRMRERSISFEEVKTAIKTGEIIEQYPDDYPFQSCLILAVNINKRPLHVVVGYAYTEIWIITVYVPDIENWLDDFKTRRENKQ